MSMLIRVQCTIRAPQRFDGAQSGGNIYLTLARAELTEARLKETNVSDRLPDCWCMVENGRGTLPVGVPLEAVRNQAAVLEH
jgi:hypothetical protein